MAADGEYRRIEEDSLRRNSEERAFIADLGSRQDNQGEVEPRSSVRIAYRLEGLVGKGIVGGIHHLPVRGCRRHRTAGHVLEWLDGVEHMPDITEGYAAVVCAEDKGAWVVR